MDRRRNNGSVKAVSPRHCTATSALRNCCFNCRAWAESQRQCPLHCCWRTTRSEGSPTFAAQLHLPAHDLLWANLRVQLHLPPSLLLISWSFDLAWNPGLTVTDRPSVAWVGWLAGGRFQTSSIDLRHPSFNHCRRSPKTVNYLNLCRMVYLIV